MEKLRNTETGLIKSAAYKKEACIRTTGGNYF